MKGYQQLTRVTPDSDRTGDWRARAICRNEDPEVWFPVGTSGPAMLQLAEAKAICRRCPVAQSCLDDALADGLNHGVFGGLDEDERRALGPTGRRPIPAGCGSEAGATRHRRRDEPVCEDCRAAAAQAWTRRKARREAGVTA